MACRCGWDCSCTSSFGTRRRRASERRVEEVAPAVGGTASLRSFLAGRMFHSDGVGEDYRVRNDDLTSFFRGDDRGAGLNVIDRTLDASNADEITNTKRFLNQQENAGKKILQNILKSKSNRDTADAQDFDQVGRLKRWGNDGQRD